MQRSWQIQEAKNKLSEVVEEAIEKGPQILTRRGLEVAVVLSYPEYLQLKKKQTSLSEFFRQSPWRRSIWSAIVALSGPDRSYELSPWPTSQEAGRLSAKRVHDLDSRLLEIAPISGDHGDFVDEGRRRDQAVFDRHGLAPGAELGK
jgi:prevent-host-death family protein